MSSSHVATAPIEHLDYAIVGGGLSGIGAAVYYRKQYPKANQPGSGGKSFAIFEGRNAIGGTWDLFRYPGIRSDSDMKTFAFSFNPWLDHKNSIAPGHLIRDYIAQTATNFGIAPLIRLNHRAKKLSWDSATKRWTIDFDQTDPSTGAVVASIQVTAKYVMMATGYYKYDDGFTPSQGAWETLKDDFKGDVIHPQKWPENYNYDGKKVVVIGSGATAITLVPNMAERAAHVTMLQRSPTWMISLPTANTVPFFLSWLPKVTAARCMWFMSVMIGWLLFVFCRLYPKKIGAYLHSKLRRRGISQADIDTHFTPKYNVWDERFCVVANGDLFRQMRTGRVSIVTGTIDRFLANGVCVSPVATVTAGGTKTDDDSEKKVIEADVIVTATGLNVEMFGGATIEIDGKAVNIGDRLVYRGMMISGVPNFAIAIGYTNASWTLKIELAFQFLMKVMKHADRVRADSVTPVPGPHVQTTDRSIFDLASNYVRRAKSLLPRQGSTAPWVVANSYPRDYMEMAHGNPSDGALIYA